MERELFSGPNVFSLSFLSFYTLSGLWAKKSGVSNCRTDSGRGFQFMSVWSVLKSVGAGHSTDTALPKGGRECLMSPLCLEFQGCHLNPLYYLLSCSSAYSHCFFCLVFFFFLFSFFFFFAYWFILLVLSPEKNLQYFSLRDRLFLLVRLLFSS